jgi:hypothetical protein
MPVLQQPEDPFPALGAPLACALVAQVFSVMIAALLASQVPAGYRVRSWVFLAGLLWSLAGTVLLLVRTAASAARGKAGAITAGRIALWLVSSWAWPILVRPWRAGADERWR